MITMDSKQLASFIRSRFFNVQYAPSVNVLYSQDAYVAGMILVGTQSKILSLEDQEKLIDEQQSVFNKRMKELKGGENK